MVRNVSYFMYKSVTKFITYRATIDGRDVIILYGNAGELHETAIRVTTPAPPSIKVVSGSGKIKQKTLTSGSDTALALQYTTTGQTVVEVGGNILLYIVGM